jgi:VPDSG-CTERM motif
MKTLKYTLTILTLVSALAISAKADLMFLGAVAFGPNNSPTTNHDVLQNFLGSDPGALSSNFEGSGTLSGPVTVTPGEFFVVHYGKGSGGSAKGGSFEFFQVINGETSVTFPQNGTSQFGTGGISSARGFGGTPIPTPDSGTTVMLLGSALAGLGLVRRYLKK